MPAIVACGEIFAQREAFRRVDRNCGARAALSRYDLSAEYLSTDRATTSLSPSSDTHSDPIEARNRRPSIIRRRFFEHDGRDARINALQLLAPDLHCPRTCCSFGVST